MYDISIDVHVKEVEAGKRILVEWGNYEVQRGLFTEGVQPAGMLAEVRIHLAMKEGKRDKVTSCLRLLATPRVDDCNLVSLPDPLFFLYYALRPLRLTGKYATRLLRRSANRKSVER